MNIRQRKLTIRTATGEMHNLTGAIHKVLNEQFKRSDIYASCLSCLHWDDTNELCKKYKQRPPAHIIVDACPDYDDNNNIPF